MSNDNGGNNDTNRSDRFAYSTEFAAFLSALDSFLYSEGWYINGRRIIKRRLVSIDEVEKYLYEHCYDREEALEIVQKLWKQVMNDPMKEFWERGYNDYWNGIEDNNCPTWPDENKRNAWMEGWLFGKWSNEVANEAPNENLPTTS